MRRGVLITGGAKRLGALFCRTLAEAGWAVAVHYNRSREEAEALAGEIGGIAVGGDLSDLGLPPRLIRDAGEALGVPLTGLVNSASIFEHDTAADTGPESLQRHFAVNTAAPVLLAQAFAKGAPEGDAAIVNVLDQKLWNPNPDHFAYTLSKSALREATTLMAQAFAPKVRVIGVAPGYCLPSPGQSEESFEAQADRHNALKRRLDPDHVAQAVRFALENPAITGTTLLADNGEHLVPTERDVAFKG